jgi:hypothetical protein
LRLNFMAPIRLLEKHSKILAGAGLHLRHGYFGVPCGFGRALPPYYGGTRTPRPVLW